MPFEIVRNDITNMHVDAIVNTANPKPVIGYGTDAGIHLKAGPRLLEARKRIGRIRVGDAVITPGFDLPAKYVIHTVGPVWQGGDFQEEALLRSCYARSLKLAKKKHCQSIAFPLICAGNHGFPKPLALQIAMSAISEFLLREELQVYLVVFSKDAFRLSEKLFHSIASFIDENYILQANLKQYGVADKCSVSQIQQNRILEEQLRLRREAVREESGIFDSAPGPESAPAPQDRRVCQAPAAPFAVPAVPQQTAKMSSFAAPAACAPSLSQLLEETDAGFSETLLRLIDKTGKKDSDIYTKANVSRQHFSKIRNNPLYRPTKATAIAFAIALELDMDQTRDLIGRAGYALTNSSKFDVIIMYFIRQRNYNMFDINAALFEFDQSLLGA